MDALETLFRPLIAMVNRQIAAKTPAQRICGELDGRCMAVRVRDTGLGLDLRIESGCLTIGGRRVESPDVVICGSLLALASLSGPDAESAIRNGAVDVSGNAIVAQQFRRLLRYGRPDLEEELASVVGDAAAHRIGAAVRRIARWGREARSTMRQNIAEYLTEESRVSPTRYEVEEFAESVGALRDDVDRLEARLDRLHAKRPPGSAQ